MNKDKVEYEVDDKSNVAEVEQRKISDLRREWEMTADPYGISAAADRKLEEFWEGMPKDRWGEELEGIGAEE